jgi:lysozyme family protein
VPTTFDDAFEDLIGHEGGYVNDPRDPGGETKYGISKRAYPHVDIKALTVDQAKVIYRRDYWAPAQCDTLPASVAFDVFDMAVNSGVTTAIRTLQKALGVTPDGVLGAISLGAAQRADPYRLRASFNGERLAFMTDLKNWPAHGKGWARRIAANLRRD